jgi:kynurenine formamidase
VPAGRGDRPVRPRGRRVRRDVLQGHDLYGGNPYLAPDAAEAVAAAGPSAIGLDFAVDAGRPWPNHTVLLGAEVLLIENLVGIAALPPEGFTVYAFPLRVAGENGAPARVVAEVPG